MTFRQYSIVMSLASLVAWVGWLLVVFLVDPASTGLVGLLLFYVSFSSALVGTLALIGLLVRAIFHRQAVLSKEVSGAFRQGLMITALLIGSLFLQHLHLLTWWNSTLLVIIFGLIELFLITRRPRYRTLPDDRDL